MINKLFKLETVYKIKVYLSVMLLLSESFLRFKLRISDDHTSKVICPCNVNEINKDHIVLECPVTTKYTPYIHNIYTLNSV